MQAARPAGGPGAVALALALALAVWVAPGHIAASETVSLSAGSEGCLAAPPNPPRGAVVREKDSKLLVSWTPPEDGRCIDTYIIDAYDASSRFGSDLPVQTTSTTGTSTVLDGLSNGVRYRLDIQSFASSFASSGDGTLKTSGTPTAACDRNLRPGKPIGLRLQPDSQVVQVCWDGVENDACVDKYSVSAVESSKARFRSSEDGLISRGACVNVTGLRDGVEYTFSVTASNNARGAGATASATATPTAPRGGGGGRGGAARAGWTCKGINGCRPGSASYCAVSGCGAVERLGGCRGPFMFDVDAATKQVSQWCAEVCVCDISLAEVFGSPFAWGFQAMDALFGGGGADGSPALSTQVASELSGSLAASNPLLAGALNAWSKMDTTGGRPTTSMGSSQYFGGSGNNGGGGMGSGGIVSTLSQSAADSGVIAKTVGNVAGQVTSSVVSSVVSNSVNSWLSASAERLATAWGGP